jgi:hypothetical protein
MSEASSDMPPPSSAFGRDTTGDVESDETRAAGASDGGEMSVPVQDDNAITVTQYAIDGLIPPRVAHGSKLDSFKP